MDEMIIAIAIGFLLVQIEVTLLLIRIHELEDKRERDKFESS